LVEMVKVVEKYADKRRDLSSDMAE
jgi:hypothetical protein